jgi:hypothetical protein
MTQEDWTKMNKESHYNSLIKQDLANRKLIKKLQLERDELKKQLKLYGVVKRTLDRKIAAYELVNMWFAKEYNTGTDRDEVESMEKEAAELNAQIKVLRYIDSTVKTT